MPSHQGSFVIRTYVHSLILSENTLTSQPPLDYLSYSRKPETRNSDTVPPTTGRPGPVSSVCVGTLSLFSLRRHDPTSTLNTRAAHDSGRPTGLVWS